MSRPSSPRPIPPAPVDRSQWKPLVSALLWLAYQSARKRQFAILAEHGFGDLTPPLINVMIYPHPDAVRQGDLAERLNIPKQTLNYLLKQLESLGYLERRAAEKGSSRRLIYVTDRGWKMIETHREAVLGVEKEWEGTLGKKRFAEFKDSLRILSGRPE